MSRPTPLYPFFNYFGGKWRIARRYPAPRHDTIVEPFAGSASYSLYYHDCNVTLIDRDPNIVATWRYLIGASSSEILALPDIGPGQSTDDLNVCEEAKLLIGWWLNSGSIAPRKRMSKWAIRDKVWPKRRARIASQAKLIRHWKIIEGDATEICDPNPCDDTTWFVDPPYERVGKLYRFGSNLIDYDNLSAWCRSLTGQVIVCESEGATWLPFRKFHNALDQRKRRSAEAIWTNDEQETARGAHGRYKQRLLPGFPSLSAGGGTA